MFIDVNNNSNSLLPSIQSRKPSNRYSQYSINNSNLNSKHIPSVRDNPSYKKLKTRREENLFHGYSPKQLVEEIDRQINVNQLIKDSNKVDQKKMIKKIK